MAAAGSDGSPRYKEAEVTQTHHIVNHPAGRFFVHLHFRQRRCFTPSHPRRVLASVLENILSAFFPGISLDVAQGPAGDHSGRRSAGGGGTTLELRLTLRSDWDLKADPGDQLSTIRRHHLGESSFFKAKQPFQSSALLPVWSPVAPPVETLFSISVGPEDEHLLRSEQLFDQDGFSFQSPPLTPDVSIVSLDSGPCLYNLLFQVDRELSFPTLSFMCRCWIDPNDAA